MTPNPKERKSISGIGTILEPVKKSLERPMFGISGESIAILKQVISSKKVQGSALELQKLEVRQGKEVTLEDVKHAAFLLLKENDSMSISPLFQKMLGTRQLNELLTAFLNYFSAYLHKLSLESKPRAFVTDFSAEEKIEITDAESKIELARKFLARAYSTLLLGLGMAAQHHMACGKAMGSSTHKDRQLFECLYTFCTYVTWVTFRRKSMDMIQAEVGRLLRSNVFNPAQKEKENEIVTSEKISQGEYRRLRPKRPPINSIVNQRSPVLMSLLPTPKEKSKYLFKQHQVNPEFSADMADEKTRVTNLESPFTDDVGIIGEPLTNFFPDTLISIEAYMENKGVEEEDEQQLRKSELSLPSMIEDSTGRTNSHRQNAVTSRATTEALYSDHDL
ncbi:protein phosphatase 1 regulatory subunit 36 [Heptranchias perlo]|uniref:protein phosphatase 1 regulatory subunit 36 n=1 Tax=Heptranchias perlo TaxID=212740 RepID=UPI003559D889